MADNYLPRPDPWTAALPTPCSILGIPPLKIPWVPKLPQTPPNTETNVQNQPKPSPNTTHEGFWKGLGKVVEWFWLLFCVFWVVLGPVGFNSSLHPHLGADAPQPNTCLGGGATPQPRGLGRRSLQEGSGGIWRAARHNTKDQVLAARSRLQQS